AVDKSVAKSVDKSVEKSAAKPAKSARHPERQVATSTSRARPRRHVSGPGDAAERDDSGGSESDRLARIRAAYRQGNERLFSGDAAGAITAYEEMVRLNPKD